jgi:hypothetical protein
MRTSSKLALFGLAVAGLAWWLGRRREPTASHADTPSASARFDDVLELPIDVLVIDELGLDEDAKPDEADEDDVGLTSRRFVDVDLAYVGQEMGDAYALQMDEDAGASTEELEEGYRGIEAGESWLDAINVAAVEGGTLTDPDPQS